MNNLTVLILAAGYGRRMGPFSRMVNKGLIPYGDKPLISHIIDRFPGSTKFVIACGHMGSQVKDYVSNVHQEKNIVFVDIPDYSEGSTGPATTVQHCSEHIKDGFILLACDTLFEFNWSDRLDHSWIGVYPVDSHLAKDYDWIERDGDDIVAIHNKKSSSKAVDAFIGFLYDKDGSFLKNLQMRQAKENIEGFPGLELKAHTVRQWLDFGTYEKWKELNKNFPETSFPKPNEIFYHDNNKVIKFFIDDKNVSSRVDRVKENPDCMPKNLQGTGNFLIHDWVDGDILYNQITPLLFQKMLSWCESRLWKLSHNSNSQEICHKFYFIKTQERLLQLRTKYSNWSEPRTVNNQSVNSIDFYLENIDWNWLCKTTDWRFIHGDLHFDNTIYNPLSDEFTAIDWRTDFAGEMYGDLYYDLAKLLGGIYLSYKQVKKEDYKYIECNDNATIEIPSVEQAEVYEILLKNWVIDNDLDWKKVITLVPLIYLNMSPLHDYPFDKFLVALAQLHFKRLL